MIMIRRAEIKDAEILAGLEIQMWGDHTLTELADEFNEIVLSHGIPAIVPNMSRSDIMESGKSIKDRATAASYRKRLSAELKNTMG